MGMLTIRIAVFGVRSIQENMLRPQWHPLKLTVWCIVYAKGIIGPYFFRREEVAVVSVNTVPYRHVFNRFLFPKIQELDIDISWF